MSQDRNLLRQRLRESRRAIPAQQRMAAAEALAERLRALPFLPGRGHVAGYWAMDGEIALHAWQMRLPSTLEYCLPVLHGKVLRFAPWKPGQPLVTNRYGIPEPAIDPATALPAEAMSLVLMPLVGFDSNGCRLGMGGGWYDRSFAFRNASAPPPWLVGVGFAAQRVEHLDRADWDVPADVICTETETLSSKNPNG